MNKPTLQHLIRAVVTVASLPTIYLRLDEAIREDAPHREVAAIISDDVGLASRLLRIANSPFYGFPSKIDTITRAVTIIGTRQLAQLVLAMSMVKMIDEKLKGKFDLELFWKHSITCAAAARLLASYRRESNIEKYFVAGLLHDIGRVVMMMVIPDWGTRIFDEAMESQRPLYDVEQELLGYDHAKIGGELLREWRLPPALVESTIYHHRPRFAKEYPVDAALVHVAEVISNCLQISEGGHGFVPALYSEAWDQLELPLSIIAPLFEQLRVQRDESVRLIFPDRMHAA
ncbi:MAG: HDOD domain-containing protein [Gammaproteobacteria bacterium]|nr:HDOD domain-containing protein [Gammaproteobacteria bacterium]